MKNYSIPLQSDSHIQVIFISIEQWKEEWSARDEEIMTYAIKNVAEEFFLAEIERDIVFKMVKETSLLLLCMSRVLSSNYY